MTFARIGLTLIVAMSLFAQSSPASAQGSGAHGGGMLVRLNHRYQLADIFQLEGRKGLALTLTPQMKELLAAVQASVSDYARTDYRRLWEELTGDYADFRLVSALPCAEQRSPSPAVLGEKSNWGACTEGGVTYLDARLFSGLETIEQVLLLIHERCHTFDRSAGAHQKWITPFVQGVRTLLTLQLEQSKGVWRKLHPFELRALRDFLETPLISRQLQASPRSHDPAPIRLISPQGGARIYFDTDADRAAFKQDEHAYVGVDSVLVYSRRLCGYRAYQPNSDFKPALTGQVHVLASLIECASIEQSNIFSAEIHLLQSRDGLPTIRRSRIFESHVQLLGRHIVLDEMAVNRSFIIHDSDDISVNFTRSKISESEIDYTEYMRFWYRCMNGFQICGEPVEKLENESVFQNKNIQDRRREGWAITRLRQRQNWGDVQIRTISQSLPRRVRDLYQ